jgi:hypothetical protein
MRKKSGVLLAATVVVRPEKEAGGALISPQNLKNSLLGLCERFLIG